MHIFFDNFHQGVKCTAKMSIQQAELRREEILTDQKYLFITSLQTDYLSLDSNSGSDKNDEGAKIVQIKCTFCAGANYIT